MLIQFWTPTSPAGNAKMTVHRNGNMGFSSRAVFKMGINEKCYMKIGTNASDSKDSNLYLMRTNAEDPSALKINKAGNYYYINTKNFFDELTIDYIKRKIIYDISETKHNNKILYKLTKREIARKKK